MKIKDLKIGTQLWIGFAITMAIIIVMGVVGARQNFELKNQTQDLFNHPYKVRAAIGALRHDIDREQIIHRDLILKINGKETIQLMQTLELLSDDALKQFDILSKQYLDTLILNDIKIVKGKGYLSSKNVDILSKLSVVNVFYAKEVLEKKLIQIDPNIPAFNVNDLYNSSVSQLNIEKIKKEGLLVRCLIWGLILIAFFVNKNQLATSLLLLSSLLIWFINHLSPFFSNTRSLKNIVKLYLFKLESSCGRTTINYRFIH